MTRATATARPALDAQRLAFAADVRAGLDRAGQKELPSKYLYDEVGSALFEVICLLPEYGLSRAGARLLERHAVDVVAPLGADVLIAELGSGNARNTRWILEALATRQSVHYFPIDISGSALAKAERELDRIPAVRVLGFEREYLEGLTEVAARRRPGQELFVLFLGGTIGNFDRDAGDEFLRQVRQRLAPGDRLLISTDLEKPADQLFLAYDDPIGVTAAFDLNLLARMNRELGAHFDLARFRHRARWHGPERRIEMHLESLERQRVLIAAADLVVEFAQGETIWTESSHKYARAEIPQIASRNGYRLEAQWIDEEWPFAQNLFRAE